MSKNQLDQDFEMEDKMLDEEEFGFDDFDPNPDAMNHMLTAMLNGTMDLTKLIIENRVRNSQKMTDQDIYDIYSQSYIHFVNATK